MNLPTPRKALANSNRLRTESGGINLQLKLLVDGNLHQTNQPRQSHKCTESCVDALAGLISKVSYFLHT